MTTGNIRQRRKALFTRGESNAKTRKGLKLADVDTLILHLAPANEAGVGNVCASASPGCLAGCLYRAGRAGILKAGEQTNPILERRKARTREYFANPAAFVDALDREIQSAKARRARTGREFVVRVNGTSDLPKVALELAARHPDVTLYDYTKHARPWERVRANYTLTFSRTEANEAACFEALAHGVNVAVVFDTKRGHALPASYYGIPVVDGDVTDLRYLDPTGVVVGLRAKGKLKGDRTGFVVRVATLPANVCPPASAMCRPSDLMDAGRGAA